MYNGSICEVLGSDECPFFEDVDEEFQCRTECTLTSESNSSQCMQQCSGDEPFEEGAICYQDCSSDFYIILSSSPLSFLCVASCSGYIGRLDYSSGSVACATTCAEMGEDMYLLEEQQCVYECPPDAKIVDENGNCTNECAGFLIEDGRTCVSSCSGEASYVDADGLRYCSTCDAVTVLTFDADTNVTSFECEEVCGERVPFEGFCIEERCHAVASRINSTLIY